MGYVEDVSSLMLFYDPLPVVVVKIFAIELSRIALLTLDVLLVATTFVTIYGAFVGGFS
tara:strand:- start:422 stop:598 length:177 start_codon:yes stop_codon:yes gene_type:complete